MGGFNTSLSDMLPEVAIFDPHACLKMRTQPISCTVNNGLFHAMPNVQKVLSCAGKWRIHLPYSRLRVAAAVAGAYFNSMHSCFSHLDQ